MVLVLALNATLAGRVCEEESNISPLRSTTIGHTQSTAP